MFVIVCECSEDIEVPRSRFNAVTLRCDNLPSKVGQEESWNKSWRKSSDLWCLSSLGMAANARWDAASPIVNRTSVNDAVSFLESLPDEEEGHASAK